MPVIPLLPCFDRFLVISIFERKKGGGCRRGNLFNQIDLSQKWIANSYSFIYINDLYKNVYIYSKEIRRFKVMTSNNAPVVKQLRVLASCAVDRGFDQRSDQIKDYKIYIGTWRKRIKAKTN